MKTKRFQKKFPHLSSLLKDCFGLKFDRKQKSLLEQYDCPLHNAGNLSVAIYRIQREYFLSQGEDDFLKILSIVQSQYTASLIYYSADIGKNFTLVHSYGTVIGSKIIIGDDCFVYHNVTIGARYESTNERPTIGDHVTIYAGAKILGQIKIGDRAVIGANSVVINDVAPGEIWAGVPARLVRRKQI